MAGRGRYLALAAAAIAAVAIGVIALVAGGGDGTTDVGTSAVAEAAERTANSKGLRYTMTGETEAPQVGRIAFTGTGQIDVRGQRSTATVDMSQMAERMRELGEKGELTDRDAWQMKVAVDSRFLYMRFPLTAQATGKPWMKIDFLKSSQALGIDPVLMRATQQQGDPTMTLRHLRTVSDDVAPAGTETVRGVETTRYRATVDMRKYPDLVPAAERDRARRSVDALVKLSGGDPTSDMEVWVGRDKLVRRMKWNQAMQMPGQSTVQRSTYTMEFTDFDATVDVAPPDAGEVFDATDQVVAQMRAQGAAP